MNIQYWFFQTNRFYTSLVYAMIAYNVYTVASTTLPGKENINNMIKVKDESGLLKLLFRVALMFMVRF